MQEPYCFAEACLEPRQKKELLIFCLFICVLSELIGAGCKVKVRNLGQIPITKFIYCYHLNMNLLHLVIFKIHGRDKILHVLSKKHLCISILGWGIFMRMLCMPVAYYPPDHKTNVWLETPWWFIWLSQSVPGTSIQISSYLNFFKCSPLWHNNMNSGEILPKYLIISLSNFLWQKHQCKPTCHVLFDFLMGVNVQERHLLYVCTAKETLTQKVIIS